MSTKYDDLMLEFESADEAFEDEQFKDLFSAGEYAACLDALFYGGAIDDAIDLWKKLIDEGKNPLQGSDGIEEEHFYKWEYFPELTIIPGTVEGMGFYCFSESNLVDVILEPGVMYLNGNNFEDCKKLRSIYIPKTVEVIESDVFTGCDALKTINFGGTKEQWDSLISGDEGINKKCVVNFNVPVPKGTINEGYDRSKYYTKRSIKTNPDNVGIGHWINNYR